MKVMEYEIVKPIVMKNGEQGFLLQEKYNSRYKIEWSRKEIRDALKIGTIKVKGLKLSACGNRLLVDNGCPNFAPKETKNNKVSNTKLENLQNYLEKNVIECVQTLNNLDEYSCDTRTRLILETKESVYNEILSYVNSLIKIRI